MRLSNIEIAGFKSIRDIALQLHIDHKITVILGANDHGKTNILEAIEHLNPDLPFTEEEVNWDLSARRDEFPRIVATFELSQEELHAVLVSLAEAPAEEAKAAETEAGQAMERAAAAYVGAAQAEEQATAAVAAAAAETPAEEAKAAKVEATEAKLQAAVAEVASAEAELEQARQRAAVAQTEAAQAMERAAAAAEILRTMPRRVQLTRRGLDAENQIQLLTTGDSLLDKVLGAFLQEHQPRVEIIKPFPTIADAVAASDIIEPANEFMQGIFYTAGLEPIHGDGLFAQNLQTQLRLDGASDLLDKNLRSTWVQGDRADLHFRLRHNQGNIELLIRDPAVESQYVQASRRSSGFTHFFTTRMVLHARQQKHLAASYILLFDEPGFYLHPDGQRDLLQVLEALAANSQIIYVTHSVFMINRNYPTRHRLVFKDRRGTRLDGKPYAAQWKSALDALGLSLPGTILFAPNVLLTEGDTDPIYIGAVFQFLIYFGLIDEDINGFSALSTGDSVNTRVLLQLLLSASAKCNVAILVDGDAGGKQRLKSLQSFLNSLDPPIQAEPLSAGSTIEDSLPFSRSTYPEAVATYWVKLGLETGIFRTDTVEQAKARFVADFGEQSPNAGLEQNLARWATEVGHRLYEGLPEKASKIGIAREYVELLLDKCDGESISQSELRRECKRAIKLTEWISNKLGLPGRLAQPSAVTEA